MILEVTREEIDAAAEYAAVLHDMGPYGEAAAYALSVANARWRLYSAHSGQPIDPRLQKAVREISAVPLGDE